MQTIPTNNKHLLYFVKCEVLGEQDRQRYRALAVVIMEDPLKLDEKLSIEFAKAGYAFIHSGKREGEVNYLEKQHDAEVLSLSQQVNLHHPIAFNITGLFSASEEQAKTNYLTITEHNIPQLPNQEHLAF